MQKRKDKKRHFGRLPKSLIAIFLILSLLLVVVLIGEHFGNQVKTAPSQPGKSQSQSGQTSKSQSGSKESKATQKATIMASRDMLYHDIVYGSAFDGEKYDFSNDYEQITP